VSERATPRLSVAAITFDFGNTLVPIRREDLVAVVGEMTEQVRGRSGPFPAGAFEAAWAEEIKRRIESIEKGEVQLVPWDEMMRSMRERLNAKNTD